MASAHADDAEIGAGGTIRRLVDERPDASVRGSCSPRPSRSRAAEARASAQRLLEGVAERRVDVRDLRDGYLPFLGEGPKDVIAAHAGVDPDLILAPRRDDAHQDHRLVRRGHRPGVPPGASSSSTRCRSGTATSAPPTCTSRCPRRRPPRRSRTSRPRSRPRRGRDWFSADTFMAPPAARHRVPGRGRPGRGVPLPQARRRLTTGHRREALISMNVLVTGHLGYIGYRPRPRPPRGRTRGRRARQRPVSRLHLRRSGPAPVHPAESTADLRDVTARAARRDRRRPPPRRAVERPAGRPRLDPDV